jgi:hypothetical protein
MFKAPNLSEFMRWHHNNLSKDGYVRHVVDSKAWVHINSIWPEFAQEPHNLRLGLCLGRSKSIWEPVKHMIYVVSFHPKL